MILCEGLIGLADIPFHGSYHVDHSRHPPSQAEKKTKKKKKKKKVSLPHSLFRSCSGVTGPRHELSVSTQPTHLFLVTKSGCAPSVAPTTTTTATADPSRAKELLAALKNKRESFRSQHLRSTHTAPPAPVLYRDDVRQQDRVSWPLPGRERRSMALKMKSSLEGKQSRVTKLSSSREDRLETSTMATDGTDSSEGSVPEDELEEDESSPFYVDNKPSETCEIPQDDEKEERKLATATQEVRVLGRALVPSGKEDGEVSTVATHDEVVSNGMTSEENKTTVAQSEESPQQHPITYLQVPRVLWNRGRVWCHVMIRAATSPVPMGAVMTLLRHSAQSSFQAAVRETRLLRDRLHQHRDLVWSLVVKTRATSLLLTEDRFATWMQAVHTNVTTTLVRGTLSVKLLSRQTVIQDTRLLYDRVHQHVERVWGHVKTHATSLLLMGDDVVTLVHQGVQTRVMSLRRGTIYAKWHLQTAVREALLKAQSAKSTLQAAVQEALPTVRAIDQKTPWVASSSSRACRIHSARHVTFGAAEGNGSSVTRWSEGMALTAMPPRRTRFHRSTTRPAVGVARAKGAVQNWIAGVVLSAGMVCLSVGCTWLSQRLWYSMRQQQQQQQQQRRRGLVSHGVSGSFAS